MFHSHPHHGHGRRFARGERRDDAIALGHDAHGHGRHRRDHGHGRHARLGRFFAHGDLRLVILHLIAEKPRHGYEIIKAIEDQVGGAYSPSPGVIYPTLTHLEELGHVTVTPGEGAKKLHAITAEGQAYLDAHRSGVEALLARMAEAERVHGDGMPPQVLRAMENLKLALRLRLQRGPLSDEQANTVAETIDVAATGIERV